MHFVTPREMAAVQSVCEHALNPSTGHCVLCGQQLALELDIREDKYLGEPGTYRYEPAAEVHAETFTAREFRKAGVVFDGRIPDDAKLYLGADLGRHDREAGVLAARALDEAARHAFNTPADFARRREPARPPPVPRPAGLQVRDAREKARLGLRGLAFRLGISVVELGEIERGLRSPAELWWKLREVLPGLGDMPPWTPSTPANTFAIPHPTGRCTCGGGGGGTCGWCKMDQHRTKREDRRKARATSTKFQRLADSDDYQGPTGEEALALLARDAERLRQHEAHQRKQARRRRRGF